MADTMGGASRPAPSQASSNEHQLLPPEWPSEITGTIVDSVGKVRDKTTGPAVRASRGLVYGLVAGILGVIALIVLLILAVRVLDNYLPGSVWIVYLGLGALFTLGGVVLWIQAFKAPVEP